MGPAERAHWIAYLYFHAEKALLGRAAEDARTLAEGVSDATIVKARQLAQYEHYARNLLDDTHQQVITELHQLIEDAANEGRAAALLDLAELGYPTNVTPSQQRMIDLIVRDLELTLNGVPSRALRNAVDIYQQAQAVASGQVALGALTRIDATQYALDALTRQGITAFVDKAGRKWGADTYTEMATRTGAMNTMIEAKLDTYWRNDMPLVYVSDSPRECDLCRPWENQILTVDGTTGVRTVRSVTTGEPTTVNVVATVEQARAAGLFHPNCSHSISSYLPGATRHDVPTKDNPEQYQATQKQRYYERQVRQWTLRRETAITVDARILADDKVREWSDKIDKIVATGEPAMRRRPEREDPFTAR